LSLICHGLCLPPQQFHVEQRASDGSAERTGHVRPAIEPVQARASDMPVGRPSVLEVNPNPGEGLDPRLGDLKSDASASDQPVGTAHPVTEGDAPATWS